MKNSHLTDTQYITYFLRRHKLKYEIYDTFVSEISNLIEDDDIIFINKIHQTLCVDLKPYIFTMLTISEESMSYFIRFMNHYLKHASCDLYDTCQILSTTNTSSKYNNLVVFFYMAKQSTLTMMSVLYIMQYFFL